LFLRFPLNPILPLFTVNTEYYLNILQKHLFPGGTVSGGNSFSEKLCCCVAGNLQTGNKSVLTDNLQGIIPATFVAGAEICCRRQKRRKLLPAASRKQYAKIKEPNTHNNIWLF